jgi:hypothetical protein
MRTESERKRETKKDKRMVSKIKKEARYTI